jgi:hypothetical protein
MTLRVIVLLAVTILSAGTGSGAANHASRRTQESQRHDRQFWRNILKARFLVPDEQPVFPLVQELSGYLGSTDPELRDDLAYTILDVWIVHQNKLTNEQLIAMLLEWQGNLRAGIGAIGTDSVFKRSFSALCLAALAERDLTSRFLSQERYQALLENALTYLKDERDLRGFDPAKGWIHATAHTADLLAYLAMNALLKVEDCNRIWQAISNRTSSAHVIFAYGEQDRLAFAASSIIARTDFDAEGFHRWLAALDTADRKVWKQSPPNDDELKTFQNNSYLLEALAARLYALPKSTAVSSALDEISGVLRRR